ncbi:hypothetical protein RJ641_022534 [Dillenia turbinata]|uniref:Uncharacterized protein n=1 Tax=Dillenia turbinata TaxID=194707 RepID=A0AAN8YX83_9MAGN
MIHTEVCWLGWSTRQHMALWRKYLHLNFEISIVEAPSLPVLPSEPQGHRKAKVNARNQPIVMILCNEIH